MFQEETLIFCGASTEIFALFCRGYGSGSTRKFLQVPSLARPRRSLGCRLAATADTKSKPKLVRVWRSPNPYKHCKQKNKLLVSHNRVLLRSSSRIICKYRRGEGSTYQSRSFKRVKVSLAYKIVLPARHRGV